MRLGTVTCKMERSYIVDLDDKAMVELAEEWLEEDFTTGLCANDVFEHMFEEEDRLGKLKYEDIEQGLQEYREELNKGEKNE
jgi:hypothetical protein